MSLIRYLNGLRQFTKLDANKRLLYLEKPDRDFTRKSPLSFARTVSLVTSLLRRTLAIELFTCFGFTNDVPVTKSAFCQRRRLIKPSFFKDLFTLSATTFYQCFKQHNKWKGKLLFAVDGTGQKLPNEQWIGAFFGFHLNQHSNRPSTRLLIFFDLLNKVIYRVVFHSQKSSEIVNTYPNVETLPCNAIYIYDRGFFGYGLPFLHRRHGSDCVIRMPVDASPEIQDFIQSDENERIISVSLNGRAYYSLLKLGLDPERHAQIKVRLIKVILDTGEIEVLLTTLLNRNRFHYKHFKWLYGKRWGIETAIFVLKSFLQLALSSAYTQPGVEQDIWATFLFYNKQSAIIFDLNEQVKIKTAHRQYGYQVNRNVTAGLIKKWIYSIYLDGPRKWRARTKVLLKHCLNYLEPYRPRTKRERERLIMRAQGRHIPEKNYRKAI